MVMIHMALNKNTEKSSSGDKYVVQRIGGGSIVDHTPIFSPDGKLLYAVYDHVIRAFSTQTGDLVRDFKGLSHPAIGVQVHPARPELVVAMSETGEMMAWRCESGIHMMTVRLKLAADCKRLTGFYLLPSEDGDCDIYITWLKKRAKEAYMSVFNFKGHHETDLNLSFDPNGRSGSFAFGQHCDGRYVAAIWNKQLCTVDLKRNVGKWFKVKKSLTCVACHPTEACIATGNVAGQIHVWKNFFDDREPVAAEYHWHTLPVSCVIFSPSGSYFYSGAAECVLVKWQLDEPDKKQHLPRLSAPVCQLSISKDSSLISVSTQDNAIQFVSSQLKLVKTVQYFSWGVQSAGGDTPLFPAGLNVDRRTHSLVLNSRTGHIQFYDPRTHSLLYNLDVTGVNYLTQERHTAVVNIEVIRLALSGCGKWLATVEFVDSSEMSVYSTLKFYFFDETIQNYILKTSIQMPHEGKVHALQFQPAESQNSVLTAVTTGDDKKFRIWSLGPDARWHCSSAGYYRDLSPFDAAFSTDGSVLGVSFGPSLTLWNPEICTLQCSLSPIRTSEHLMVWNILTLSIVWSVPLKLTILTKDPCSKYMAAFTANNTVFVFAPNSSEPVFQFKEICPSATKILSSIFMPRSVPRHDDSWQASSQLYFIDSNQELLALQRAEEVSDASDIGLGLSDLTSALTPFSALLAKQTSSAAVVRGREKHSQFRTPGRKELEEVVHDAFYNRMENRLAILLNARDEMKKLIQK